MKSKTSRLLSVLVAFVMAISLGTIGAKNLWASASTLQDENELTFDAEHHSAEYTVPDGIVEGQYMITLKVTEPVFTGEDADKYNALTFTVTSGGYADYLSYNSLLDAYYVITTVEAGDVLTFTANYDSTSGELAGVDTIKATVTVGGLQIGPFSGNALYGITLPANVTLNGVSAGNYYVAVSSATYGIDIPADATITVSHGTTSTTLVNDSNLGGYYALLTLTEGETLSFAATSTGVVPPVVIELRKEVTAVPFNGEVSLHAEETAVYSFSVESDGFYVLNQGESTYTPESGEPVAATALYGFVLKDAPNYVVGDYIEVDRPLRLLGGKTYYLEITCGSASAEVEGVPVEDPLVTTKFTITAWAGATLAADSVTDTPVYLEGSENIVPLTASLYAGDYTVALIGVPDGIASVTVHFGDQTLTLTSEQYFQTEEFTLNSDTTSVWVTSGSEFVVGLFVGRIIPEDTIIVNADEAKDFTIPAHGQLLCYVVSGDEEDPTIAVGTYLVTLEGDLRVSVLTPTGEYAANAGEDFGLFEVDEYTASGYYLVLENLTETADNVSVLITTETHLLTLGQSESIDVEEGYAAYYVQHIYAGDYILTIDIPDNRTSTIYVGDEIFENVSGHLELPFTVTLPEVEGLELPYSNLRLEIVNEAGVSFTVEVTLTVVIPPEVTE